MIFSYFCILKGKWILVCVQEGTPTSVTYLEVTIIDNQPASMKKNLEDFSETKECPIRNVLDRFGDKWSILVLLILGKENVPMRFNEIVNTMGDISQKMLTVTLRTLEADGLVSRKQFPEIPPRVEYELTDMGKSLLPHIDGLASWAIKNQDAVIKTREKFALKNNWLDWAG